MADDKSLILKAGKFSSLITGICTVLFGLLIIIDFTTPTIMFQFIVCFILAVSFIVVANSLYSIADLKLKLWGRITVSFAIMYAVYICLVYYSQLTVIRLGLIPGDSLPIIKFTPGSWLFAVDMLGYTFLALSTLAASFLFKGKGLTGKLRVLLIIHGILAIPTSLFPALPLFDLAEDVKNVNLGGAFALLAWCVVFAPICFLLVRYFSVGKKDS